MSENGLAKISWSEPETGERRHYVLTEGATVTIGRSQSCEVTIREQHVSRQHAVISYQYGVFMISDLGSANGTFVNDQQLSDPFPLADGDVIRLYVPTINFSAVVTDEEEEEARATGTIILAKERTQQARLVVTAGSQEGDEIILATDAITLGRATVNATWEIGLQDRAVSRPHARIERANGHWFIVDLESANGTFVNGVPVDDPRELEDGYVIVIGQTTLLFRIGSPADDSATLQRDTTEY